MLHHDALQLARPFFRTTCRSETLPWLAVAPCDFCLRAGHMALIINLSPDTSALPMDTLKAEVPHVHVWIQVEIHMLKSVL